MRRLLLHIGSHKTGTTTLQSALIRAQRQGLCGAWNYLHAAQRVDFNTFVGMQGMGAKMHPVLKWEFFERRMKHAHAKGMQDVVISTEMLFWLDEIADIEEIARQFRQHFDQIHVVAYLRRQDQLALSHRKQVVMGRAAYQFYGAQLQALPRFQPHMMRYFDYGAKLAKWQQVFGPDNVTVRRFQRADLVAGDTVADFWSLMGLDQPVQIRRKNEAWSRTQLQAGLWLRQRGYPREAFVPLVRAFEEDAALLPARAEAEAFLAHMQEANQRLAQMFDPGGPAQYFDGDMSKYPERSNWDQAPVVDLAALEQEVQARMRSLDLELDARNPQDDPATARQIS